MSERVKVEVLRSRCGQHFEEVVDKTVADLNGYYRHMAEVAAGRGDPYPPPVVPRQVEPYIRRTTNGGEWEACYEVIDDSLRVRKDAMAAAILERERVVISELMPHPNRARHVEAMVAAARSSPKQSRDEKRLVLEADQRSASIAAVAAWAARQTHAIEDLTAGTVDSFSPEDMP